MERYSSNWALVIGDVANVNIEYTSVLVGVPGSSVDTMR